MAKINCNLRSINRKGNSPINWWGCDCEIFNFKSCSNCKVSMFYKKTMSWWEWYIKLDIKSLFPLEKKTHVYMEIAMDYWIVLAKNEPMKRA